MKRLASACSWVSAATPSSRPIATSNAPADPSTADGRTARTNTGSGCEPSTESKTILSGTGSSSARGLASSPNPNRPAKRKRGGPEGAAADFQAPPAIRPAAQHAYPVRPQVRFHGPEPLVLVQPVFTPHRDGDGPERPRPPPAPPPPRGEAFLNAPTQPRDGLKQVQRRGQSVARQPRHPPGSVGKPRPGAPETRLSDRWQNRGQEHPEGEPQRTPHDSQRGDPRQRRGHEMPLGHLGQGSQEGGRGLIDGLEWRGAPPAVIHAGPPPPQDVGQSAAVHPARPADVPNVVVLLRPFALQHRLGAAIADLLPPVGAHRIATVVPHHGGRVEAERPAAILQSPAHVDVVASRSEPGIEPTDRLEVGRAER